MPSLKRGYSLSEWGTIIAALAFLGGIALQQGRILQRQEDLARDIQRLEQVLILSHPDAAQAFGFLQESNK